MKIVPFISLNNSSLFIHTNTCLQILQLSKESESRNQILFYKDSLPTYPFFGLALATLSDSPLPPPRLQIKFGNLRCFHSGTQDQAYTPAHWTRYWLFWSHLSSICWTFNNLSMDTPVLSSHNCFIWTGKRTTIATGECVLTYLALEKTIIRDLHPAARNHYHQEVFIKNSLL